MADPRKCTRDDFCSGFEPTEDITRSQWAERYRRLSPESSSKAGLFSFVNFPWQREPLNMIDSPNHGRMVLMWASQVTGKTETINNIIGSSIYLYPIATLMIHPSVDLGKAWSKDRLEPMRRDTPCLRGLIKEARSRDSGNTILHKQFPGGQITIVGANAPRQLASRPIGLVLADEIDGYPESSGEEGDPIKLAEKRTESFPNSFVVLTSTPLIKGTSRIEGEYIASDQRQWWVPCPKCKTHQVLEWGQVKWDDDDPATARMECQHCRKNLSDNDRRRMVAAGEWRAAYPERRVVGFHISGINSLLPPKRPFENRLVQMVSDCLESQKTEEMKKTWTNTFLAESYEPPADKQDPSELLDRREVYAAEVPAGGLFLVKTVDVQKNRLEIYTEAIGLERETWAIDFRVIPGDPAKPSVWQELTDDIAQEYRHENGHALTVALTGIDAGYKTDEVRKWVKSTRRRAILLKGDSKAGGMLFRWQNKLVQGLRLHLIGTDTAKDSLFAEFGIEEYGAGFHHFPLDDEKFGQEYFAQLTAEHCRTIYDKNGFPKRQWWKPKHARNEALDLKVYAKATARIFLHHKRKDFLTTIAAQLAEPAPSDEPGTDAKPKRRDYYLTKPEKQAADAAKTKRPRFRKAGFAKGWR